MNPKPKITMDELTEAVIAHESIKPWENLQSDSGNEEFDMIEELIRVGFTLEVNNSISYPERSISYEELHYLTVLEDDFGRTINWPTTPP
jgi:hypothetical protein